MTNNFFPHQLDCIRVISDRFLYHFPRIVIVPPGFSGFSWDFKDFMNFQDFKDFQLDFHGFGIFKIRRFLLDAYTYQSREYFIKSVNILIDFLQSK